jgi:predicted PurR-regulated permease PerM
MSKASNKKFVNFFKSPTQHKNNMNKFSQSINQSNKNISESIKRSNARIDNNIKKSNQKAAEDFKMVGEKLKDFGESLGTNTQNQLILAGVVGGVVLLIILMK